MHFSLQLDPTAEIDLRITEAGNYEILVTDPNTDNASTVIEISKQQMAMLDLLRAQIG